MPLSQRNASLLSAVLSVIAGSTDTIGYLGLHGLFTAQITGNLVIVAAHITTGNPAITALLLAVPVFMLVLLGTSVLTTVLQHRHLPTLAPLLALELLLLISFDALCVAAGSPFHLDAPRAVLAGMFGVAAMAVQSALVQTSLSGTPVTGVMTTNVTNFVLALGQWLLPLRAGAREEAHRKAMRILPVIVGFMLGCALGAAAENAYGLRALALPAALAVLAMLMGLRLSARG
jgi:uncharacterized membrane protein YoaK (UPF0700 family)